MCEDFKLDIISAGNNDDEESAAAMLGQHEVMGFSTRPARPDIGSANVCINMNSANKKRVLLVEDEPLVLLAERQMIKKLGMEVDEAVNGEIAVRAVKEKNAKEETKYDLVLMDINMPVMNGYIASKAIHDMAGSGQVVAVPLVCLSAQDSAEHRRRCEESGIIEMGICGS